MPTKRLTIKARNLKQADYLVAEGDIIAYLLRGGAVSGGPPCDLAPWVVLALTVGGVKSRHFNEDIEVERGES